MKQKIQNCLYEPKQLFHVQVVQVQPIDSLGTGGPDNIVPNHLKIFRSIWDFIDLIASVFGVSMYKEMEANFRIVLMVFLLSFGTFSLFYTMASIGPSLSEFLEVICLFGVLLPVCAVYILVHKILQIYFRQIGWHSHSISLLCYWHVSYGILVFYTAVVIF